MNPLLLKIFRFKNRFRPSQLNGSLTPYDALKLAAYLILHYPLDLLLDVKKYEDAVSVITGAKYVFALGSGRMGLYMLLKALDLPSESEIIVPGYTCVVIPNAIRFAECKPVYVDINLNDFNMDPDAIEAAITPTTKAVLLQHTYGIPADIDRVREICNERKLFLIEDATHALGAVYGDRSIGQWGDAAIFSTETSKMISTDRGGILVTNNKEIANKIKILYDQLPIRSMAVERISCIRIIYNIFVNEPALGGRIKRLLKILLGRIGTYFSFREGLDFPSYDRSEKNAELDGSFYSLYPRRLSGILSKIGLWQIKRLSTDLANRREKALLLENILSKYGVAIPLYDKGKCRPSFLNFPFLVDSREKWQKEFNRLNINASGYLMDPLHPPETTCHAINGYIWGSCKNAEYVSSHILNLPLNRTMTKSMIGRLHDISSDKISE